MTTALDGIATPFGPLSFTLKVSENGKEAALDVQPLQGASCNKIVVHCGVWTGEEGRPPLELDPRKVHHITIQLNSTP